MGSVLANVAAGVQGPDGLKLLAGTGSAQTHLLLVCTADPGEAARRFARFTGRPVHGHGRGKGDTLSIALDRGRLGFAAPQGCRALLGDIDIPATPFIAAVALASGDMTATARYFDTTRMSYRRIGDTLHVAATDAMGAALVIHPPDAAWPPLAS